MRHAVKVETGAERRFYLDRLVPPIWYDGRRGGKKQWVRKRQERRKEHGKGLTWNRKGHDGRYPLKRRASGREKTPPAAGMSRVRDVPGADFGRDCRTDWAGMRMEEFLRLRFA